jgi:hypothetical protein
MVSKSLSDTAAELVLLDFHVLLFADIHDNWAISACHIGVYALSEWIPSLTDKSRLLLPIKMPRLDIENSV